MCRLCAKVQTISSLCKLPNITLDNTNNVLQLNVFFRENAKTLRFKPSTKEALPSPLLFVFIITQYVSPGD